MQSLQLYKTRKNDFIQLYSKKEVEKVLKDPQEGKLIIFDQLFFTEEDKKMVETLV